MRATTTDVELVNAMRAGVPWPSLREKECVWAAPELSSRVPWRESRSRYWWRGRCHRHLKTYKKTWFAKIQGRWTWKGGQAFTRDHSLEKETQSGHLNTTKLRLPVRRAVRTKAIVEGRSGKKQRGCSRCNSTLQYEHQLTNSQHQEDRESVERPEVACAETKQIQAITWGAKHEKKWKRDQKVRQGYVASGRCRSYSRQLCADQVSRDFALAEECHACSYVRRNKFLKMPRRIA